MLVWYDSRQLVQAAALLSKAVHTLSCVAGDATQLAEYQVSRIDDIIQEYTQRLVHLENIAAIASARRQQLMPTNYLVDSSSAVELPATVKPETGLTLDRPKEAQVWRQTSQQAHCPAHWTSDPEAARLAGIPHACSRHTPVLPPADTMLLPFWLAARLQTAMLSGAFILPGVFVPRCVFASRQQRFQLLPARRRLLAALCRATAKADTALDMHNPPSHDSLVHILGELAAALEASVALAEEGPQGILPPPHPLVTPLRSTSAPPHAAFGGAFAQGVHGPASPAHVMPAAGVGAVTPPSPPQALHGAAGSGNTHASVSSHSADPSVTASEPAMPPVASRAQQAVRAVAPSLPVGLLGSAAVGPPTAQQGTAVAAAIAKQHFSSLHMYGVGEGGGAVPGPSGPLRSNFSSGSIAEAQGSAVAETPAQSNGDSVASGSLWGFVAPALSSVFGAAAAPMLPPRDLALRVFAAPPTATPLQLQPAALATQPQAGLYWQDVARLCSTVQRLGAWCTVLSALAQVDRAPQCDSVAATRAVDMDTSTCLQQTVGTHGSGVPPGPGSSSAPAEKLGTLLASAIAHALASLPFLAELFPLDDDSHAAAVMSSLRGEDCNSCGRTPCAAASGKASFCGADSSSDRQTCAGKGDVTCTGGSYHLSANEENGNAGFGRAHSSVVLCAAKRCSRVLWTVLSAVVLPDVQHLLQAHITSAEYTA